MIRKLCLRDPLPPVLRRTPHPLFGCFPRVRRWQPPPRQRDEGRVTLRHSRPRLRSPAFDTEAQIGVQMKRQAIRSVRIVCLYGAVTVPVEPPRRLVGPVAEHGLADDRHIHRAAHTLDRTKQAMFGVEIRRRTAMRLGATVEVVPGTHRHGVADDEPPCPGLPGCLDHQTSRQVAAGCRDLYTPRVEVETAGGTIQDGTEDTG